MAQTPAGRLELEKPLTLPHYTGMSGEVHQSCQVTPVHHYHGLQSNRYRVQTAFERLELEKLLKLTTDLHGNVKEMAREDSMLICFYPECLLATDFGVSYKPRKLVAKRAPLYVVMTLCIM